MCNMAAETRKMAILTDREVGDLIDTMPREEAQAPNRRGRNGISNKGVM